MSYSTCGQRHGQRSEPTGLVLEDFVSLLAYIRESRRKICGLPVHKILRAASLSVYPRSLSISYIP